MFTDILAETRNREERRYRAMPRREEPQWQPINRLPTVTMALNGMLEAAQEMSGTLEYARQSPQSLDDYTVNRLVRVHREQLDTLSIYDDQLRRWQAEALTPAQRQEVTRLVEVAGQLREVLDEIIELGEWLKARTIEKTLAKNDEELGLEFFMGMMGMDPSPPPRPTSRARTQTRQSKPSSRKTSKKKQQ
jgi:hypothetical protein